MTNDPVSGKPKLVDDVEYRVRVVVYVKPDSVWCGIFVHKGEAAGVQAFAQSFVRPDGRSVEACVSRALQKIGDNLPVDYSVVHPVREEW